MTEPRKSYQNLPSEENPHFLIDGQKIYQYMKQKYPEKTVEHLDNILNGICASLTILMRNNVDKDDHKRFLQLIYLTLMKNI